MKKDLFIEATFMLIILLTACNHDSEPVSSESLATVSALGAFSSDADPNDCKDILGAYTEYSIDSRQKLIEQIRVYRKEYLENNKNSESGANIGVVIPIDGILLPINLAITDNEFDKYINETINKYEQNYQFDYSKSIRVKFLPEIFGKYWLDCILNYSAGPRSKVTQNGQNVSIDITISDNFKDASIAKCFTYDQKTGKFIDIKKQYKLSKLSAGKGLSFDFQIQDTTESFFFRFVTDRYRPLTVYIPAKGEKPFPTDPTELRFFKLIEIPTRLNVGNSSATYTGLITDKWGNKLKGEVVDVKITHNSPDPCSLASNQFVSNEEGKVEVQLFLPARKSSFLGSNVVLEFKYNKQVIPIPRYCCLPQSGGGDCP